MKTRRRAATVRVSLFGLVTGLLTGLVMGPGCDCSEPVIERSVELTLVPDVVDFGAVPVGARNDSALLVRNDGNTAWEPTGAPLLDGAGFRWLSGCDAAVGPGQACTATVRFEPTFVGAALASFTVQRPNQAGIAVNVVGRLDGTGTPAVLLAQPDELDFGDVTVGASRTLTFRLENRGADRLQVPLAFAGVGFFVDGASDSIVIDGGASVDVGVVFAPVSGSDFAGSVTAEFCGAGCGPVVSLRGHGLAPRIDVQPRTLDLGAVQPNQRATATLHIENTGTGALVVDAVSIDDDSFSITGFAGPTPLDAGAGFDVEVVFEPVEGRNEDAAAFVVIDSSDPVSGSVVVPVAATSPGPGIDIIPRAADYGFMTRGEERRLGVVLRSTGDAAVDVESVRVVGDDANRFFVEGLELAPIAPNGAVQFFVVASSAGDPARAQLVVVTSAGTETADLQFFSGDSGCVPRAVIAHANLGAVQVGLSKSGDVLVENVGDAACHLDRVDSGVDVGLADDADFTSVARGLDDLAPGGSGVVSFGFAPDRIGARAAVRALVFDAFSVPVLVSASGNGVRGGLVGAPGVVDIGPAPRNCDPPFANVTFFNDGQSPVTVDSLAIAPPAGFSLTAVPTPFRLLPGQSVPLVVRGDFATAIDGVNLAVLTATSTDGLSADVSLRFSVVAAATEVTETFDVPRQSLVDVLFVVDNSGSMFDDQQLLAASFQEFIRVAFADPDLDVQLGVTTTDVISPDAARGRLIGVPPILDGNDGGEFAERVQVGVDGTGLELGLEAMRLALEVPENANFVRRDAALAVVFVTDEEDGGDLLQFLPDPALSRTPDEYIALLEDLKAGAVQNTPVLVSGVLPVVGANRYQRVVDHFGGSTLDIEDPTWGQQLGVIAEDTFSLSRTFQLGSPPAPGSVVVTVDGDVLRASDFTVEADRSSIILNEPASGGAEVVITYSPECQ